MHFKNIQVENLIIGKNVVFEEGVIIKGINGKAKNIAFGDNVYIGKNVQIICDYFSLGDYSKIHHDTNIHGYKPCQIGHNAWIGQYSIIDSIGGTIIGNNCGVGAQSQLWSHIKYGDTLEGCNFLDEKPLTIGNDVWFVGHCIVSPIIAADKSMALVGSVVTKNMEYNTIYAGSPAKSITDKVGPQFKPVTLETKFERMCELLRISKVDSSKLKVVMEIDDIKFNSKITYFNVSDRRYTKRGTENEIAFMKFLLPDKAKFIPYSHENSIQ